MIKGIIFDLDGTTLDTIKDLQTAVNKTAKTIKYNVYISEEDIMHKVGHGFKDLLEKSLPEASEEEIEEALKHFREFYKECYADNTKPYDGIEELLEDLQKLNIKLAVNSNKGNDFTVNLIKKNFPNINFISIIGQRDNVPKKPDPTSANEIVSIMNLDKSEVLYIGDSETDINTAKNAKLKSIGCAWGFRGKEVLEKVGSDYIAETPKDILEIVKAG